MQFLGRQVGRERRHQRHRGVGERVLDVLADQCDEERDADPDRGPAGGGPDEIQRDLPMLTVAGQRDDRRAERDQGRRVVQQGLALQNRDDPPRQPNLGALSPSRRPHRVARRRRRMRAPPPAGSATASRRPGRRSQVVKITRPTASQPIAFTFALTSTSDVLIAAEYSSGGSRPTSTNSGLSSNGSDEGQEGCPDTDDHEQQRRGQVEALGQCAHGGHRGDQREYPDGHIHSLIMVREGAGRTVVVQRCANHRVRRARFSRSREPLPWPAQRRSVDRQGATGDQRGGRHR